MGPVTLPSLLSILKLFKWNRAYFSQSQYVRFHVASPICRAIGSSCSLI